jgi:hypothetical protein
MKRNTRISAENGVLVGKKKRKTFFIQTMVSGSSCSNRVLLPGEVSSLSLSVPILLSPLQTLIAKVQRHSRRVFRACQDAINKIKKKKKI